jgi:EAL domain-containing protein (putative c-di-GMP-specific phosphodiesterase class I)/GGDEF domain-containing protein
LKSKILDILDSRNISPLFQPIVDISNATVFGHEALIRGPVGTKLHSPISLLSSSHLVGLLPEVESLCREIVLCRYAECKNQNKLFVNISPTCLMLTNSQFEFNIKQLERFNLKPSDIVIEITEGSTINDFSVLKDTVARYKAYGFGIALDDLGEGFSSLRLWLEIHPDFVKIDKHFITNIQNDPIKQEFLRAIQKIATESGGQTIAEGVETRDELAVIKDLKINYAQGFLLGRPMPQFLEQLADDVKVLLYKSSITVYRDLLNNNKQATVANLITYQSTIPETFTNEQVYEMFQEDASLNSIPVVTDRKPIGLISRFDTIDRFARPYQKELHGKKPCTQFMDDSPFIVQKTMTINALSEMILNADPQYLMNGFIIVDGDDYVGTGSGHALLREITNLQIIAARYANPLTSLPGNVPINSHIDRLLEHGEPFIACYCDLDNFKPFNDAYGYRRGDELIQFVGRLLSNVAIDERDFVGHIGGDDFILLFQSENWEALCNEVLNTLSKVIPDFYDSKDVEVGGIEVEDRLGNKAFYPFGSISIGAIRVEPALFKSHHEVAGAMNGVKKQAKKITGNSLFIDRRLTG